MKFRKKQIEVEAHQFTGQPGGDCPPGVYYGEDGRAWIDTLEGPLHVSLGDWIITGVQGERYPCKPDIFAQTYERLEE